MCSASSAFPYPPMEEREFQHHAGDETCAPGVCGSTRRARREARVRCVSAAESVEKAFVENWRGPMRLEDGAAPDFLDSLSIGPRAEKDRTNLVIGGAEQDQIVHHHWTHRIH